MKKPDLALALIDRSLKKGYQPGIVIIDAGYGNNTNFLLELEKRKLKYLGGLAKNRKVKVIKESKVSEEIRLDKLTESLPAENYREININLETPRKVWVTTLKVAISRLQGTRTVAIVMNAATFEEADDIDYFITNVDSSIATSQWFVDTYSQRNWVEVFYREAKGWLGLNEYQVRDRFSLRKHFILVFCAYTFIMQA